MKTTKVKRERVREKRVKLIYSSDKGRPSVKHDRGTVVELQFHVN